MDEKISNPKNSTDLTKFSKPLIDALRQNDSSGVIIALQGYKLPGGDPDFNKICRIPKEGRLPELYAQSPRETLAVVGVALHAANSLMNLSRPMTPEQTAELAGTIIDSAKEDNLSLEDLMIFIQELVRGKHGSLYESMDIPKFMEKFENYRQRRYEWVRNHRDEMASNFKSMGDANRYSEELIKIFKLY